MSRFKAPPVWFAVFFGFWLMAVVELWWGSK